MSDFFLSVLDETASLKAPFIWQGGKTKSLSKLLDHIPYKRTYIEAFGGSGAVLLARRPCDLEVFNDRNSGLIDFYRCLQGPRFEELIQRIQLNLSSRELFTRYQDSLAETKDLVERAAMWYYLQQTSFGGLGRNWGRATSPVTQNANKIYKNLPDFPQIHQRLKNVQVENLDWTAVLNDYDSEEAVIYLDPPYLDTKNMYQGAKWTREDQLNLLKRIFECKGTVVLSGYNEPLNDMFPFDAHHTWDITSSMRNDDTLNQSKVEHLWIKY